MSSEALDRGMDGCVKCGPTASQPVLTVIHLVDTGTLGFGYFAIGSAAEFSCGSAEPVFYDRCHRS